MTESHAAGWVKLHHINLRIAAAIGPRLATTWGRAGTFGRRVKHTPPEVVTDTCEILGRGTEEDIKARIHWLRMYYPQHFSEPV